MYNCEEKKPFLCETGLAPLGAGGSTNLPATPSPQAQGCQPYGNGHRTSCYYFGEDRNSGLRQFLTFDAARTFCQTNYQADLVVINNEEEEAYINAFMARIGADFWIGLRDSSALFSSFSWWINDDYVSTSNWAHLEPATLGAGVRRCVAMHGGHTEFIIPGISEDHHSFDRSID